MLKNASYAIFGKADKSYLEKSRQYLIVFQDIALRMRDFRDPISNTEDGR